jgi:DNA-directed RNA polymerase subunit RPC12/RpoP
VKVECPNCRSSENLTKVRQPVNFTIGQFVFVILGGAIGGLFWALGQENKYRCERCQKTFFSHTRVSRVFWILAVITYVAVAVVVVYALILLLRH